MNNMIKIVVAAMLLCFFSCKDDYDDERINQKITDIESRLLTLEGNVKSFNEQLSGLNQIFNSEVILHLNTDKDGNCNITYQKGKDQSKTIILATSEDVVSLPMISIGKDETDNQWYWRYTTDNGVSYSWLMAGDKRIIVGGTAPVISIDKDGYWIINGTQVLDADKKPILANDLSNTVFKSVKVSDDGLMAVFTLADNTQFQLPYAEALDLTFDAAPITAISDYSQSIQIKYQLSGYQKDNAIVECFTAYNVTVTIDRASSTITVKLNDGAESGNVIFMAHANGNTVFKPLFFTYGTTEIMNPQLESHVVVSQSPKTAEVEVPLTKNGNF